MYNYYEYEFLLIQLMVCQTTRPSPCDIVVSREGRARETSDIVWHSQPFSMNNEQITATQELCMGMFYTWQLYLTWSKKLHFALVYSLVQNVQDTRSYKNKLMNLQKLNVIFMEIAKLYTKNQPSHPRHCAHAWFICISCHNQISHLWLWHEISVCI